MFIEYDCKDVRVKIDGTELTSFGKDDKVSISRNVPNFKQIVGCYGESCRIGSDDKSGTVTITTTYNSNTSAYLATLALLDFLRGEGVFRLTIIDIENSTIFQSNESYIDAQPDISFKRDIPEMVYTIKCSILALIVNRGLSESAPAL